jgi:hypothetical protein
MAAGPDNSAAAVTCPAGVTRPISARRNVTFGDACRGGRRLKLRYRGTARNNAWLKRRTAALNLRNLLGRGIIRRNGIWVLA